MKMNDYATAVGRKDKQQIGYGCKDGVVVTGGCSPLNSPESLDELILATATFLCLVEAPVRGACFCYVWRRTHSTDIMQLLFSDIMIILFNFFFSQ